jgi:hypothetical protein
MGIAGVRRHGEDVARGTLRRGANGVTYEGVLEARATGKYDAHTLLGNCADTSAGTQQIWAVALIEAPSQGMILPPVGRQLLVAGSVGDFDLNFFFFPETAPSFTVAGHCQEPIRFEGYGGMFNEAPYLFLPQSRAPGDFLPFNDTRWTTQNGLRLVAPPAGGYLEYEDTSDVMPALGVVESTWQVQMGRGAP